MFLLASGVCAAEAAPRWGPPKKPVCMKGHWEFLLLGITKTREPAEPQGGHS